MTEDPREPPGEQSSGSATEPPVEPFANPPDIIAKLSNLRYVLKFIRNEELGPDFITDTGYCIADIAHQYLVYRWRKRRKG